MMKGAGRWAKQRDLNPCAFRRMPLTYVIKQRVCKEPMANPDLTSMITVQPPRHKDPKKR